MTHSELRAKKAEDLAFGEGTWWVGQKKNIRKRCISCLLLLIFYMGKEYWEND